MAEQKFLGEAGLDVLVDSMKTSQTDIDTVQSQVSSLKSLVTGDVIPTVEDIGRGLAINDKCTPLYMDGMCYSLATGSFISDPSREFDIAPTDTSAVLLTSSTTTRTGANLFNALKNGLPPALMVPVALDAAGDEILGWWPFVPDPNDEMTLYGDPISQMAVYKCATHRVTKSYHIKHDISINTAWSGDSGSYVLSEAAITADAIRPATIVKPFDIFWDEFFNGLSDINPDGSQPTHVMGTTSQDEWLNMFSRTRIVAMTVNGDPLYKNIQIPAGDFAGPLEFGKSISDIIYKGADASYLKGQFRWLMDNTDTKIFQWNKSDFRENTFLFKYWMEEPYREPLI